MDYAVVPFGGIWQNGMFNVPSDMVDKYFKFASNNQIKALLFILRQGGQADTMSISKAFNIDKAEADELLEFWMLEGVVTADGNAVSEPEKKETVRILKQAPEAPKLSPRDIVEFIRRSSDNAALLNEAESVKGRSLSEAEKSAIVNMIDFYALKPEVILMLLHFYFNEQKKGLPVGNAYLLKTAANWSNEGINTIGDAEVKLAEIEKSNRYKNQIKAITGLSPITGYSQKAEKQNKMISEWFKSFDVTMITLAFDTMKKDIKNDDMAIREPSLEYMNSILKRWKKYNISNPQQLEDYLNDLEQKQTKIKNKSSKLQRKPTYDMNELKRYARENTEI